MAATTRRDEHFANAERLREMSDRAFDADDPQRGHELSQEAGFEYADAGVGLTPLGKPFGPSVERMRKEEEEAGNGGTDR